MNDDARIRETRRPWALVAACAALLLVPGTAGAEWTANGGASLDTGVCGRNLQVGSDRTASITATPTFVLHGDGGGSSYTVTIDGRRLGRFSSNTDSFVCVRTRKPLSDGRHLLVGTEVAPNAGATVRLTFRVDTRAPRPPSRPALSAYSDTGKRGDGITTLRSVNLTGKAGPREAVQIDASGRKIVAGASADAKGRWSATTVPLKPGVYRFTAVSLDRAGNRSRPSAAVRITIKR